MIELLSQFDPLTLAAAAGAAVTFLLCLWRGARGLWWSLLAGLACLLLLWAAAWISALAQGVSRTEFIFAFWGLLLVGVGYGFAAWLVGSVPATILGSAVRWLARYWRTRRALPPAAP